METNLSPLQSQRMDRPPEVDVPPRLGGVAVPRGIKPLAGNPTSIPGRQNQRTEAMAAGHQRQLFQCNPSARA